MTDDRGCEMWGAYVGEAFLKKDLPHAPSQKLFVKSMEKCLKQISST